MTATNETMTVTLAERIEQIKEIIWTVGAYTPLPEELANIHKMIKTNDPKLENALNAFFGDTELDEFDEFDEMFAELDDTEDSDDDMFLFNMIDEMFVALDNP
jgi:hypothetical protein